eukprot:EC787740.1.p1 GENE.EC787740.1~~EC787740.1.p1  ORF type:complete len:146 (+),score=44.92 EC787740.1:58-495(+)
MRRVASNTTQHASLSDSLHAFASAVRWTEPLILGLCLFHALVFSLVVLTRRRDFAQIALFLTVVALAYVAEPLNRVAASHWRLIASQPYFDQRGVFASIFYSGPLLVAAFIMLVNALVKAAHMMVFIKRRQLRQQLDAQQRLKSE